MITGHTAPARIRTAMVLAAGLGTRMRPLTDKCPKPLIAVDGKPLIDYALDRFAAAGIDKAVVNIHYLADLMEDHLQDRERPRIVLSDEREDPLETGGALIKAAPELGTEPVFCTNTDAILTGGTREPCERLAASWDNDAMDALLLLVPPENASGYQGRGDFILSADGTIGWPDGDDGADRLVFTGLQIIHPRLFAGEAPRKVSTRAFWDKAMAKGRLKGVVHDGLWMHVGDPDGLAEAERILASRREDEEGERPSASGSRKDRAR